MATVKSDVVTLLDGLNPSTNVLESSLKHGVVRLAAFSYATGVAGPAVGDVIQLVKVPAGARIFGIYLVYDAMSSGVGIAGADYGDSGVAGRFALALDMDAASTGRFLPIRDENADLMAKTLGMGYKYPSASIISATVTGEAWAANKRLSGYVLYSTE